MLDYYKKEMETAEMQVALASDGYEQKINKLSEMLMGASVEESDKLFKEIKFAREALASLEERRDYFKNRYQEECDKHESKTNDLTEEEVNEIKKVEFGDVV